MSSLFDLVDSAIGFALGGVGVFALFVCVERLMFTARTRIAEPMSLKRKLRHWNHAGFTPSPAPQLGWLNTAFDASTACVNGSIAPGSGAATHVAQRLHTDVDEVQKLATRFHGQTAAIVSTATSLGMFGTTWTLATSSTTDPTRLISVGIVSTAVGIAIAIPVVLVMAGVKKRNRELHGQAGAVLDSLEPFLFEPCEAQTPAEPPQASTRLESEVPGSGEPVPASAIRAVLNHSGDDGATLIGGHGALMIHELSEV